MNDSLEDISGAPPPAPHRDRAAHRESEIPNRLPRYVSLLIVLAATSTGVVIKSRALKLLEQAGSTLPRRWRPILFRRPR